MESLLNKIDVENYPESILLENNVCNVKCINCRCKNEYSDLDCNLFICRENPDINHNILPELNELNLCSNTPESWFKSSPSNQIPDPRFQIEPAQVDLKTTKNKFPNLNINYKEKRARRSQKICTGKIESTDTRYIEPDSLKIANNNGLGLGNKPKFITHHTMEGLNNRLGGLDTLPTQNVQGRHGRNNCVIKAPSLKEPNHAVQNAQEALSDHRNHGILKQSGIIKPDRIYDQVLNFANSSEQQCIPTSEQDAVQKYNSAINNAVEHNKNKLETYTAKFEMPKNLVENTFPDLKINLPDLLQLCINDRTPGTIEYDELSEYYSRKLAECFESKKTKCKPKIDVNYADTLQTTALREAWISLPGLTINALLDTGATNNIITEETLAKVNPNAYKLQPIQMKMSTATGTTKGNITAYTTISTTWYTTSGKQFTFDIQYLVAKTLSHYSIILGDGILKKLIFENQRLIFNIRSENLIVPVFPSVRHEKCHGWGFNVNPLRIKGHSQSPIKLKLFLQSPEKMASVQCINKDILVELPGNQSTEGNEIADVIIFNKGANEIRYLEGELFFKINEDQENYNQDPNENLLSHMEINNKVFDVLENTGKLNDGEEYFNSKMPYGETFLPEVHPSDKIKPLNDINLADFTQTSDKEKSKILQVLKEFNSIFAKNKLDIGTVNLIEHLIQINPHKKVVNQKQRFMSENKQKFTDKAIEQWVEMGVVAECDNPKLISNLCLVPRVNSGSDIRDNTKASKYRKQFDKDEKETSFRITVDLRSLNEITMNVNRPNAILPEQIIEKLQNKRVSNLDLSNAYFHLKLTDSSTNWTAFFHRRKVYKFLRLSQGLISAPFSFNKAMELTFSIVKFKEVLPLLSESELRKIKFKSFEDIVVHYFDDLFVYTSLEDDVDTHCLALKCVLHALKLAGFKIGINKCSFYQTQVKVLGLHINTKLCELYLDKKKGNSILLWQKPTSKAELQSRLFSLSYYARFLPYLKEILAPLFILLRLDGFQWDKKCEESWNKLKLIILADIKITIPDKNDQLILCTDASKVALSQVLFTINKNNEFKVAGLNSKILSTGDALRDVNFKESLSLAIGLKHFLAYLVESNKPPLILCDARNLLALGRSKERSIFANNMCNYLAKLAQLFQFNIYSIPSEMNLLSDLFSRSFPNSNYISGNKYNLSREQIHNLPFIPEDFNLSSDILKKFLISSHLPEKSDTGNRFKKQPKTVETVWARYNSLLPEHSYANALLVLKQISAEVNRGNIDNFGKVILNTTDISPEEIHEWLSIQPVFKKPEINIAEIAKSLNENDPKSKEYKSKMLNVLNSIISKYMGENMDGKLKTKIRNCLEESFKKMLKLDSKPVEIITSIVGINNIQNYIMDSINTESEIQSAQQSIGSDNIIHFRCTHKYKPKVGLVGDAGIDLYMPHTVSIPPMGHILVDLGVQILIPQQCVGILYCKSSAGSIGITTMGGVIDCTYTGQIKAVYYNFNPHEVKLTEGKAYCQIVLHKNISPIIKEVDQINLITQRGSNGFGSTTLKEADNSIFNDLEITHKISPVPNTQIFNANLDQIDKTESTIHFAPDTTIILEALNYATENIDEWSIEQQSQAMNKFIEKQGEKIGLTKIDIIKNGHITKELFMQLQKADEFFGKLFEEMEKGCKIKSFTIKNNLLYKMIDKIDGPEFKLCVPLTLIYALAECIHQQTGHAGSMACIRILMQYFYSPKLTLACKEVQKSCLSCMLHVPYTKQDKNYTKRSISASRSGQILNLDLITNLPNVEGFTTILISVDDYSLFTQIIPMKSKSSEEIKRALRDILCSLCNVEIIRCDNDPALIKATVEIGKENNIKIISSAPFEPRQNGRVENGVKLVKTRFTKMFHDDKNPKNKDEWLQNTIQIIKEINDTIPANDTVTRYQRHFNTQYTNVLPGEMSNYIDKVKLKPKSCKKVRFQDQIPTYDIKIDDIVTVTDDQPGAAGTSKIFKPRNRLELFKVVKNDEPKIITLESLLDGSVHTVPKRKITVVKVDNMNHSTPLSLDITKDIRGRKAGQISKPKLFNHHPIDEWDDILRNHGTTNNGTQTVTDVTPETPTVEDTPHENSSTIKTIKKYNLRKRK